jgi:hypothetical protein
MHNKQDNFKNIKGASPKKMLPVNDSIEKYTIR